MMACKIYRKLELDTCKQAPPGQGGRYLVEREIKMFAKVDHPNVVKI